VNASYHSTYMSRILSIGRISEPTGARFGSDEIGGYVLAENFRDRSCMALRLNQHRAQRRELGDDEILHQYGNARM
jgi:hypothetical protein